MGRTIGAAVVLLLAVGVSACAAGEQGTRAAPPEALAFSARLVGGGTFEGEDYAGRDVDGEVWQRFGIVGQPAWVFVDADSGETEVEFGALGADALGERFERWGD